MRNGRLWSLIKPRSLAAMKGEHQCSIGSMKCRFLSRQGANIKSKPVQNMVILLTHWHTFAIYNLYSIIAAVIFLPRPISPTIYSARMIICECLRHRA